MTDPFIIAGGIASAPLVLDAAKRLLGPSLDMLGDGIKSGLVNRKSNVHKVAERADAKADTSQPGAIPPRVASEVFDKAQWAEDEFVAEYLSGMLASARTLAGIDDSAVSWTALVGRLSSDQLRLHYALYSAVRGKVVGQKVENLSDWESKPVFVGYMDLITKVLAWDGDTFQARVIEAGVGLEREGLIDTLAHGSTGFWEKHWSPRSGKALPDDQFGFLMFQPTSAGAMLFLRAHGHKLDAGKLTDVDLTLEFAGDPNQAPLPVPGYWADDLPVLQQPSPVHEQEDPPPAKG
ncbi:MAG: hypothetical protein NT132_04520 [Microbacterium sp.]|uniref:hypothetical protein n=1 Tax=Microbacterium sp. TaxID=51671 RepID=UPI00260BDECE|nr:hypothetical protein [Microbacterium sp.]MCX6501662.1 hypothetical protein [Microbacterium sp.]